jgi:hypothetical protein
MLRSISGWWCGLSRRLWVCLLVGVVVRAYALRFGGASVAKELGGRRLHPATQDAGEKLVLEIVEELAIAGGVADSRGVAFGR